MVLKFVRTAHAQITHFEMSNIASLPKIENKGILYIYINYLNENILFHHLKKEKKSHIIHTYESDIHYCFNSVQRKKKKKTNKYVQQTLNTKSMTSQ